VSQKRPNFNYYYYKFCTQCHTIVPESEQNNNRTGAGWPR